MENGTKVMDRETGQVGYVVTDSFGVCAPDEVPVVFENTDYSVGTSEHNLEVIGSYDMKVADLDKCGGGGDEGCCVYLGMQGGDPVCLRFSSLRNSCIFGDFSAKGSPLGHYPKCQDEIQEGLRKAEEVSD